MSTTQQPRITYADFSRLYIAQHGTTPQGRARLTMLLAPFGAWAVRELARKMTFSQWETAYTTFGAQRA